MEFVSIPILLFMVFAIVVYYTSSTINYRLDVTINEIYVGDSHVQCAVNDSLLKNSKNVSNTGESFYFSYFKLKKIIENNRNIKKVYLGFSYHSISDYYDEFINGKYSATLSANYFNMLPVQEQLNVLYWNRTRLPALFINLFSVEYGYLFGDSRFSAGGYSNDYFNTLASNTAMEKRLQAQFYSGKSINGFSLINLLYFFKIIDFCKANHVTLVLLSTPLHPYYNSKVPRSYIDKFSAIVDSCHLAIMDFKNLNFGDSSFIPDGDHLSPKGAEEFTKNFLKK